MALKTEYYKYLTVGHGLRFRQNGFYPMFFLGLFLRTDRHFTLYIYLSVCLYVSGRVRPSVRLKKVQKFTKRFGACWPKILLLTKIEILEE